MGVANITARPERSPGSPAGRYTDVMLAQTFRELHHGPPILVLPNAWDAISARLFEAEGFPAVATTSAGVAAALGYPDGGVVPSREMIEAVGRIVRAVKVPVTADMEHGYDATPAAVADVILRVVAAGAVGINVEDCVPGTLALEPISVQADKIASIAKETTKAGVPIVINARTDVFLRAIGEPESRLPAAIARGNAFLAAGADCVFVPGVRDPQTIAALVSGIGGPVNILAVAGTPSIAELQSLGVARVSVGSGPMRAAMAIVRDIARELKATGTYGSFTERALNYDEVNELLRGAV
jgi:2-methylisocitrate lyase-like PEP mutase family enzyme